jgi:hypothetical protein
MNRSIDSIWRFVAMNSKSEALTDRIPDVPAPSAACITGHSLISATSAAHAGMSSAMMTSRSCAARHGVPARHSVSSARRSASSADRVSRSTHRSSRSTVTRRFAVRMQTSRYSVDQPI